MNALHPSSPITRNSLVVVAVVAAVTALIWGAAILTPLVLAIFLMVMVDGLARLIKRQTPAPEWACLPLSLAVFSVGFVVVILIVVDNSVGFATQLVRDAPKLNDLIQQLAAVAHIHVPPTMSALIDQLNPARYVGDVVHALQLFSAGALSSFLYLGFLLASRSGFRRKVYSLFPNADDREHASKVFIRIRDSIERYLWIQTVSGALIATGCGIVMAIAGQNNAVFWAFLIFIAVYIPVLGGLIGGVLPPLFAYLQFADVWRAGAIFVGIQVIMFAVGNVMLPKMQKDSLNIDPVVVLLSLAFWGATWGVPGMFLSTPLAVMMITILAQFHSSRWIAVLMSGDGAPESEPVMRRPIAARGAPAQA